MRFVTRIVLSLDSLYMHSCIEGTGFTNTPALHCPCRSLDFSCFECRGKHVSTLQIIDYTLGITASVVVTVLALVYSRRALLKIQTRAEAEGEVVPVTGSVEKSDASHNMERGMLPSQHQDSAAVVPDEMPVWVAPAGASQQLRSHPIDGA